MSGLMNWERRLPSGDWEALAFSMDRWSTETDSPSFERYEVGSGGAERITYHEPGGEGDAHYCDVLYSAGRVVRFFRPRHVELKP